MDDPIKDVSDNPMHHPDEQVAGTDDSPKFGRLLIVLLFVVIFIGVITWASETYFSK